jgi:hypothetical protein|nr:MAG TPA: hypothetical protein [Caudoviricetes sp.]
MNLKECFEELNDIVSSLTLKTIKVKWSNGGFSTYPLEEFVKLPDETVLCSSEDDFFLKVQGDQGVWLSSGRNYSSEELFNLLYRTLEGGIQLYASSTELIAEGLRK